MKFPRVHHRSMFQLLCGKNLHLVKFFVKWLKKKTKNEIFVLYNNQGITFLVHCLKKGHFNLHASFQSIQWSYSQRFTSCNSVDLVMFFTAVYQKLDEHPSIVRRVASPGAWCSASMKPFRRKKWSCPPALFMLASEAVKKIETRNVLNEVRQFHAQNCPEIMAVKTLIKLKE